MQGPETRQSLLLQLRDSSQHEAWSEFVAIYEPLVYRLARAKGMQHADALDLGQEVFAALGKAIGRFDPDCQRGSFRGWLFRIARNLMINYLSRQRDPVGAGDTAVMELLSQQPANDSKAETTFGLEYRREVFRWAAGRVQTMTSDEAWQAFWLTGVEGKSYECVAKILGKSPGAVRIARCRVLARLRDEVKRFEDVAAPD